MGTNSGCGWAGRGERQIAEEGDFVKRSVSQLRGRIEWGDVFIGRPGFRRRALPRGGASVDPWREKAKVYKDYMKIITAKKRILKLSARIPLFSILIFPIVCLKPFPAGSFVDQTVIYNLTLDRRFFLFVTTGTYTGVQIGGISGADQKCLNEKNQNFGTLPGQASEYKALLVDTLVTRRACNNTNCSPADATDGRGWVLKANTSYVLQNGNRVFTTNAKAIFVFSTGSLDRALDPAAGTHWWTGLDGQAWNDVSTCSSWTSNAGSGEVGQGNATDFNSIGNGVADLCSSANHLLCVRTPTLYNP